MIDRVTLKSLGLSIIAKNDHILYRTYKQF